jgi:hypothetical protein
VEMVYHINFILTAVYGVLEPFPVPLHKSHNFLPGIELGLLGEGMVNNCLSHSAI